MILKPNKCHCQCSSWSAENGLTRHDKFNTDKRAKISGGKTYIEAAATYAFCSQSVRIFMCLVKFLKQIAITSHSSTKWLLFKMEILLIFCEIRSEILCTIYIYVRLQRATPLLTRLCSCN